RDSGGICADRGASNKIETLVSCGRPRFCESWPVTILAIFPDTRSYISGGQMISALRTAIASFVVCGATVAPAFASAITFAAAGPNTASIQPAVDAFRL